MVCKIDLVFEGHGDRAGCVHFGIRNLPRRAWVTKYFSWPTTKIFRWLSWCIFFPPSAVCRCRGRIRTFQWKSSSRQLPESDRNRIGILAWAPFHYLIRRLTVRSREVSKPRDSLNDRITLKFDRHIGSSAADCRGWLSNFRAIGQFYIKNLTASRLNEILHYDVLTDGIAHCCHETHAWNEV